MIPLKRLTTNGIQKKASWTSVFCAKVVCQPSTLPRFGARRISFVLNGPKAAQRPKSLGHSVREFRRKLKQKIAKKRTTCAITVAEKVWETAKASFGRNVQRPEPGRNRVVIFRACACPPRPFGLRTPTCRQLPQKSQNISSLSRRDKFWKKFVRSQNKIWTFFSVQKVSNPNQFQNDERWPWSVAPGDRRSQAPARVFWIGVRRIGMFPATLALHQPG